MAVTERELASLEAGLDALELARSERAFSVRRLLWAVVPPVAALATVVAVWQVAVWLQLKPTYALPSPGDVVATLGEQARAGHLSEALLTTLGHAAVGYAMSLVLGTLLGIATARVKLLRSSIGPILAGLQSLPSVAWVPFAVIFFGLVPSAIYFVVVMGALPSIANGVVAAYDQVPPLLLRVGRAMGAHGFSLYRHVVLPAAMPGYVAGLKQAWSFSWRSLMAAELIASSAGLGRGLGFLMDSGRSLSDMSLVIAVIVLILVVGIAIDQLVFAPLDRGIRHRRGLTVA
jgi:NitT/TauT family transport system permease protein